MLTPQEIAQTAVAFMTAFFEGGDSGDHSVTYAVIEDLNDQDRLLIMSTIAGMLQASIEQDAERLGVSREAILRQLGLNAAE